MAFSHSSETHAWCPFALIAAAVPLAVPRTASIK